MTLITKAKEILEASQGNVRECSPQETAMTAMSLMALQQKKTIYKTVYTHFGDSTILNEFIEQNNAHLVVHEENDGGQSSYRAYLFDESIVNVHKYEASEEVNISVITLRKSFIDQMNTYFEEENHKLVEESVTPGDVKILCKNNTGFFLRDIGKIHEPFLPTNYSVDVRNAYQKISENIKSKTPNGRLYILYGSPGVGKSFLIRNIITECQAIFVYIPNHLVSCLSSPEIMDCFMREKSDLPIVLVLEDADAAIEHREMDNSATVSDLLNMSDGITGELVNIHILVTANSKLTNIDVAFKRPGRLNSYVEFKELSPDDAHACIQGLCPDVALKVMLPDNHTSYSLASLYQIARNHGWKSETQTSIKRKKTRPARQYFDDWGL